MDGNQATMAARVLGKLKSAVRFMRKAVAYVIRNTVSWLVRDRIQIVPNKMAIMTITFRYNCNPKYIYEEIRRRNLNLDITWIVDGQADASGYPPGAKLVRHNSLRAIKEVYSSKYWLDNGVVFSTHYRKKEGQIHIQTMHGSLGIKRLDNSIKVRENWGSRGLRIIREEENTDYIITNSRFEEDVFRQVFWKKTPMLRLGHARTDALFGERSEEKARIRNDLLARYGIPLDKKLVLYAPTHRRGLTDKDLYIEYAKLAQVLKERFGQDYVFMLRLHYKSRRMELNAADAHYVYNVTDYPDIQDLMQVTDIGITDYSSWIYDYVLTGRPGFIYATDLDRYNNVTGLYYPLEETPFPVCQSNEELLQKAAAFDSDLYSRRVKEFLEDKEAVDDGCSAKRIVDWFESAFHV